MSLRQKGDCFLAAAIEPNQYSCRITFHSSGLAQKTAQSAEFLRYGITPTYTGQRAYVDNRQNFGSLMSHGQVSNEEIIY
jgi:hypothetical protein